MTEQRLRDLLKPFIFLASPIQDESFPIPENLYGKLAEYLALLLKWNARTNLTAIRDPEEMVTRHFGEGVFAALQLRPCLKPGHTLLDVGSGAGFPGLPIQLTLPFLKVTLAESQGKKASFLQEAVRVLELDTEIWAGRVEAMPADRVFDVVTLRAVDRREAAIQVAAERLNPSGLLVELGAAGTPTPARLLPSRPPVLLPCSKHRMLYVWSAVGATNVPRETFGE